MLNLNVGLLGHVDSGKTTLAKVLSETAGTAAFDKHPQSQERGITIDLGFSSLVTEIPEHLTTSKYTQLQYTFVDCPGHASLIKTIIGGSKIIDFMILVIDVNKGIQTQTAECIVIGELTCRKMLIVLNKIDLIEMDRRKLVIDKITKRINSSLNGTCFAGSEIVAVSACKTENINSLIDKLKQISFIPNRSFDNPFLFAVDHCFPIKGQGTVCTGTVLQGKVCINDEIEIPHLMIKRKIKSIQMFRQPKVDAMQGDRVGLCIPKIDADTFERGLISAAGYVHPISVAIIKLNRIKYYKNSIASKTKFHITIGYETALATVTLFKSLSSIFDLKSEYCYLDEVSSPSQLTNNTDHDSSNAANENIFALLEFERNIITPPDSFVIGSKLDINIQTPTCRLAFSGNLLETSDEKTHQAFLQNLRIYKEKIKTGKIARIVTNRELISSNLFKKETNRDIFIGMRVELSTGEIGIIESTFGKTAKVKIRFDADISDANLKLIEKNESVVKLKFRKYIYQKNEKLSQKKL